MRERTVYVLVVVITGWISWGCRFGADTQRNQSAACMPNASLACGCPTGVMSTTVCLPDGSGPAACTCSGAAGSAAGTSSSVGAGRSGSNAPGGGNGGSAATGASGTAASGGAAGMAARGGAAGAFSGAGGALGRAGSGTAGATGGVGGGTGSSGAGGSTNSADPLDALRQACVDQINMYRATMSLPALARETPNIEACSDMGAKQDADTNSPHSSAGMCFKPPTYYGGGQNTCPSLPVGGFGGSTLQSSLKQCIDQMWAEGPPPAPTTVQQCINDRSGCFPQHGHWINMIQTMYKSVSCGFYKKPDGSYWGNQDFPIKGP